MKIFVLWICLLAINGGAQDSLLQQANEGADSFLAEQQQTVSTEEQVMAGILQQPPSQLPRPQEQQEIQEQAVAPSSASPSAGDSSLVTEMEQVEAGKADQRFPFSVGASIGGAVSAVSSAVSSAASVVSKVVNTVANVASKLGVNVNLGATTSAPPSPPVAPYVDPDPMKYCEQFNRCNGRGNCVQDKHTLTVSGSGDEVDFPYKCLCFKGYAGLSCEVEIDQYLMWFLTEGNTPYPACCDVCSSQLQTLQGFLDVPLYLNPFAKGEADADCDPLIRVSTDSAPLGLDARGRWTDATPRDERDELVRERRQGDTPPPFVRPCEKTFNQVQPPSVPVPLTVPTSATATHPATATSATGTHPSGGVFLEMNSERRPGSSKRQRFARSHAFMRAQEEQEQQELLQRQAALETLVTLHQQQLRLAQQQQLQQQQQPISLLEQQQANIPTDPIARASSQYDKLSGGELARHRMNEQELADYESNLADSTHDTVLLQGESEQQAQQQNERRSEQQAQAESQAQSQSQAQAQAHEHAETDADNGASAKKKFPFSVGASVSVSVPSINVAASLSGAVKSVTSAVSKTVNSVVSAAKGALGAVASIGASLGASFSGALTAGFNAKAFFNTDLEALPQIVSTVDVADPPTQLQSGSCCIFCDVWQQDQNKKELADRIALSQMTPVLKLRHPRKYSPASAQDIPPASVQDTTSAAHPGPRLTKRVPEDDNCCLVCPMVDHMPLPSNPEVFDAQQTIPPPDPFRDFGPFSFLELSSSTKPSTSSSSPSSPSSSDKTTAATTIASDDKKQHKTSSSSRKSPLPPANLPTFLELAAKATAKAKRAGATNACCTPCASQFYLRKPPSPFGGNYYSVSSSSTGGSDVNALLEDAGSTTASASISTSATVNAGASVNANAGVNANVGGSVNVGGVSLGGSVNVNANLGASLGLG